MADPGIGTGADQAVALLELDYGGILPVEGLPRPGDERHARDPRDKARDAEEGRGGKVRAGEEGKAEIPEEEDEDLEAGEEAKFPRVAAPSPLLGGVGSADRTAASRRALGAETDEGVGDIEEADTGRDGKRHEGTIQQGEAGRHVPGSDGGPSLAPAPLPSRLSLPGS